MLIKKGIKELVMELGGFIALRENVTAHIGNWASERVESTTSTGTYDSAFDKVALQLKERLISLGIEVRPPENYCEGDYIDEILEEALANSVGRGNMYNASLPTYIKLIECRDGYIVSIRDSGKGFDAYEIARMREEGCMGSFKNLGDGFTLFMESHYRISFTRDGTVFNVAVPKRK